MKIVIVGAGTMGKEHASAYDKIKDVELVGVVDQKEEAAYSLAQQYNARSFSSLELGIKELKDASIVDVCVPTYLHKQYIYAAAKAKKHVFCEKPLTNNIDEAQEIIEICKSNDVQLYVGHVTRFFPEYTVARKLLNEGKIGKVGTARAVRSGAFPSSWKNWYSNPQLSGTVILDLMIHDLDFFRWCFGEVRRVYAKGYSPKENKKLITHALVSLRFQNGVIAHVEGSWAYPRGFRTEFEIVGREGIIQHNSDEESPIYTSLSDSTQSCQDIVGSSGIQFSKTPYQVELEHFIECIRGNEEPIIKPDDAQKALELCLVAIKSIQTNKPILL